MRSIRMVRGVPGFLLKFFTGVRVEVETEYWCVPDWGTPEYQKYRERREAYVEQKKAEGWTPCYAPCMCCNVAFYRRVKAWPWGRP